MNSLITDSLDLKKIWNVESSDLLDIVNVIAGNGSFNGNNQGDTTVPVFPFP